MATKFISPSWRMPKNSNQSKASNYSIKFDGTTKDIRLSNTWVDDMGLTSATKLSFSMWVKPDSTSTRMTVTSSPYNSWNDNFGIHYLASSTQLWLEQGANTKFLSTSTTLTANQWSHLLFVLDASESSASTKTRCYINGGLVTNESSTNFSSMTSPGYALYFGRLYYGAGGSNYSWSGNLGQASFFDYAVTSSQVSALYNSGIPANPLAVGTPAVAYYDLGQGSAYASGSAGIVEPNLAAATGSTVFDFTGVNGVYVDVANNSSINFTSAFSVGFWFKTSSTATMYTSHGATGDIKYFFQFGGSINRLRLQIYDGTGAVLQVDNTENTFYNNNWHHLAFTTDGTTSADKVIVYFDGQPLTTTGTLSNSGIKSTAGSLKIGAYVTTQNTFDGQLSNFQTWGTELSAANITTLYNNSTPLQSNIPQSGSLKAWYKLGLDSSAYSDSKWTISDTSVNYKNSLGFNFVDSLVSTGLNMSYANRPNFSLSYWMRFDSTDSRLSNFITVFAIGIANQSPPYNYALGRIYHQSSGAGAVVSWQSNTSYNGTTNVGDNQWHNIVYTVQDNGDDTQTIKLFVDGNSTPEWEAPTLNYLKLSGDLFFGFFKDGANGTYDKHFLGQVSNVAVWYANGKEDQSSNLTNIYNNGTPQTSYTDTPSNWWKLDNLTEGLKDSTGNNNATNDGSIVSGVAVSQNNGLSSGMDSTNLVPSNLIKSIPYSGYSMYFDGSNEYIDCTDNDAFSFGNGSSDSAFSVSTWINMGTVNDFVPIAKDSSGAREWTMRMVSGRVHFYTIDNSAGSYIGISGSFTPAADEWWNFIVTYDATEASSGFKLYYNGIQDTTGNYESGTYTAMENTSAILSIGMQQNGTVALPGNISNTAIFNKVLTEDEAIRIYNGGSPGNLSSLGPNSWWSLGADSYFNGSEWICPDLGSNAINGTSVNAESEDLKGFGPDSLANGTSTNLDLGSDLVGNAPGSTGNSLSVNMNFTARTGSTP